MAHFTLCELDLRLNSTHRPASAPLTPSRCLLSHGPMFRVSPACTDSHPGGDQASRGRSGAPGGASVCSAQGGMLGRAPAPHPTFRDPTQVLVGAEPTPLPSTPKTETHVLPPPSHGHWGADAETGHWGSCAASYGVCAPWLNPEVPLPASTGHSCFLRLHLCHTRHRGGPDPQGPGMSHCPHLHH